MNVRAYGRLMPWQPVRSGFGAVLFTKASLASGRHSSDFVTVQCHGGQNSWQ